ncbi:unnamed protein product [Protopolystoma xenopodis]|uniref:Striatin N-terminal domain-containing protein n=1 Tax=Protopolystoma xenopodis TaxID=117903 RepID=A0A3S5B8C5_9PLAT|nr:unnamed protein product [Protopolystoma xenopodis]
MEIRTFSNMAVHGGGLYDSAMEDRNGYHQSYAQNLPAYERAIEPNVDSAEQKDLFAQYSFQGVLTFLQQAWSRLEMQRSQWEMERAELQTRISFLQGERRGQDNLKQDLVRRIKMLEYALKMERVKYHKLKAELNAGSATTLATRAPSETCHIDLNENSKSDSYTGTLDLAQQLAQSTEKAIESNTKWRESRNRLKKYLQEVGYTDAVLDVRQERVRQLLLSASGAALSGIPSGTSETAKCGAGEWAGTKLQDSNKLENPLITGET